MQEEDALADWETKAEQVEELVIGDTEFEVFRNSIFCSLPNLTRSYSQLFGVEVSRLSPPHRLSPLSQSPIVSGGRSYVKLITFRQAVLRLAH
jgi:hypothetical protein